MKTKPRGHVAAVAVATMVGGLLPLLAVANASAASVTTVQPTSLTVSPGAAFAPMSVLSDPPILGSATFSGTLIGAVDPDHPVYYTVVSGPDANPSDPLQGTLCTTLPTPPTPTPPPPPPVPARPGTPFTCDVVNTSGNSGVDNIRFFYDSNGTGSYVSTDQSATGTMTIGGAVYRAIISPTTSPHTGTSQYSPFTVTVTDAAGLPVTGTDVTLDSDGAAGTTGIITGPSAPDFLKPLGSGANSLTVPTADGTGGTTAGVATFYVASDTPTTLHLTATAGTPPISSSLAQLTVNRAGVNDAASVVFTPVVQNAFTNGIVQVNVTVTNSAGDPIVGVIPEVTLDGLSAGAPVTVPATDLTGTSVVRYTSGQAPFGQSTGVDTLTAWIQQSNHTVNTGDRDPGEPGTGENGDPSLNATVNLGLQHFESDALSSSGAVTVPTEVTSAPVTFTLKSNDRSSAEGFQIAFSVTGTQDLVPPATKYTVSAANAVTDANGQVTVTVINSAPAVNDVATVTAELVSTQILPDPPGPVTVLHTETVTWLDRQALSPVITPSVQSTTVGGTASFTVTTNDAFGDPVPNVTYKWLVFNPDLTGPTNRNDATNNTTVIGTGDTFSYTDSGPLNISGRDVVMVTALDANGTALLGSSTANQYWIVGSLIATQANIDTEPLNGKYVQAGLNTPWIPEGFDADATDGTTSDPTPVTPTVQPFEVAVSVVSGDGFPVFSGAPYPLYGKSVTFTSSGVGGFTDFKGVPIGNTTTALVSDVSSVDLGTPPGPATGWDKTIAGKALVFVRSTEGGTQTITATVDGITTTSHITYTGQYVPVAPVRVADSGTQQGGIQDWNGNPVVDGRLAPNTLYYFGYDATVVPQDQAAIAFNITGIQPGDVGNLRVAPGCANGEDVPNTDVPKTSLLNYQVGEDVANFAIVPDDGCDWLKIYSAGASVSVAIDLVGYYPDRDGIRDINPTRVVDTRNGLGGGSGPVAADTSRSFQITGTAGIPAGTKAVALNVTAIQPDGQGNLRVYPEGGDVPDASNINYIPNVDKASFVVVNLPADGKVSVYSAGSTANVAIDAFAYYPQDSTMVTGAPVRILDTRGGGTLSADTVSAFQVTGLAGVPADAQAVLVSVTGIHTDGSTGVGNLRVFPAGQDVPLVSTLNYISPDTDVANFAIVKLGTGGQLSLFSAGSPIDVAVDVVGYIPAGGGMN